jgi:hypothetical protein
MRMSWPDSPVNDYYFDVRGVKDVEPKIREVFTLLGVDDQYQMRYPNCDYDFPPEIRREAYTFIDRILQHTPTKAVP